MNLIIRSAGIWKLFWIRSWVSTPFSMIKRSAISTMIYFQGIFSILFFSRIYSISVKDSISPKLRASMNSSAFFLETNQFSGSVLQTVSLWLQFDGDASSDSNIPSWCTRSSQSLNKIAFRGAYALLDPWDLALTLPASEMSLSFLNFMYPSIFIIYW